MARRSQRTPKLKEHLGQIMTSYKQKRDMSYVVYEVWHAKLSLPIWNWEILYGDEKIYCIVEFIDACRERPTYRSNRALQWQSSPWQPSLKLHRLAKMFSGTRQCVTFIYYFLSSAYTAYVKTVSWLRPFGSVLFGSPGAKVSVYTCGFRGECRWQDFVWDTGLSTGDYHSAGM